LPIVAVEVPRYCPGDRFAPGLQLAVLENLGGPNVSPLLEIVSRLGVHGELPIRWACVQRNPKRRSAHFNSQRMP
jgi:hypothetical protein